MRRSSFIIILITCFCSLFSICVRAETAEALFESKKWRIVSVGKHTGKHLGFIKFNNSQLEGHSTCNLYSAVYELKAGQSIKINRVAVSQLICKAGNKMQIEEDFIAGLEDASSYKFENDVLFFFNKNKSEIARFK